MKTLPKLLLTSLLVTATLITTVSAAPLSLALPLIAADSSMIKTGTAYSGVLFSAEDFANATHNDSFASVKVTSLPAASDGILYLGSVPVAVNQTISKKALDTLRFVPIGDTKSSSFTFTVKGDYSIICQVKITDEINFAPVAASYEDTVAAWTQKDISCYGSLDAYDPEGDALCFEIVDYPAKGLLVLSDDAHGDFRYTPYANCSGTDSFTYRVRDSYGNYSETAVAQVTVSRNDHGLVFSDMSEHWAHSAAIEMSASGIMEYGTADGVAVFSPDETVSREDFLVMVMRALGAELSDTSGKAHTVFADDDSITAKNKVYVSAAYDAGIIRGREENGVKVFCPQEPITRAEAAVMINNILGAEVPISVSLFTDNETIPTWAQGSLYALNDLGILRGTGAGAISPFSLITRAQSAQILFNLTEYVG